jgi:hypothetical protein
MDLTKNNIQPADPGRDFATIAALLTTQETEPSTAESLLEWYNKQPADQIRFSVALSPHEQPSRNSSGMSATAPGTTLKRRSSPSTPTPVTGLP